MRTKRRKLKAEINVVPYVDVMLVLLIIFMVTAPLLHVGVDIKLPQAAAKSLNNDKEPVLVSLDSHGQLYLTLGSGKREPIDEAALVVKVAAFERQNPDVPVQFAGDKNIDYGRVMEVMTELQKAGVPNVGLMTQPDTNARSGDG